jgi:hypothetical protein
MIRYNIILYACVGLRKTSLFQPIQISRLCMYGICIWRHSYQRPDCIHIYISCAATTTSGSRWMESCATARTIWIQRGSR